MPRPLAFVLGLVWLTAARARASPEVQVERCPEAIERALPAVVNLEIDVLLRERGRTRNPPDRVAIRCSGDHVFLSVTLASTQRESSLDLAELAPEHRARAVALAAAELVDAMSPSSPPAESTPETAAKKTPARPPLDDRSFTAPPPESGPRRRPTLGVGVLAEWLGAPKTWLFGARLSFGYPVDGVLEPSFSLDGALGDSTSASARVRVETLSVGAHLLFGTTASGFRWLAGPGARFGWARLTGHPDAESALEGESLSGVWGGPELRARAGTESAALGSPAFAIELASGYVVLPIRGLVDGADSVFAIDGLWLSASAQVGLAL
jgi:hypothetical protein